MKKAHRFAAIFSAAILALGISSCTSITPVSAGSGVIGSRRGEASGVWLFGLPCGADISAVTAAQNGGIKRIATIDVKKTSFFELIVVRTTIVTGEGGAEVQDSLSGEAAGEAENEIVKLEELSGEAILDVSNIAGARNADSDIVLINSTYNEKFSMKVELLSKQTKEWVDRGSAKFSTVNKNTEVSFGLGYTGKLSGVEQIRLTPDADMRYTVAARVVEDNLIISLLPADIQNIDFEIDTEILGKRFSSVKLRNKSSALRWRWFAVYGKQTKDSDWEALGIVSTEDLTNNQPTSRKLNTFANTSNYQYFGITSLSKEAGVVEYEAKASGKDLVIALSSQK